MGEGFIVRRGGVATEQALAPTITKVSKTDTSITFTLTNNDASTAVILYEVGDTTPDANSIELAAAATSSNLTISDLNRNSALTLYATANVTGKVKSNVEEEVYAALVYTAATGGTTAEYDLDSKRYKSHTFTADGDFVVTTAGNGDRNQVDYLIIAGGGGGGANGGGGGAGGYLTTLGATSGNVTPNSKNTVTATTFGVVVGAGATGNGSNNGQTQSLNGTNSSVFSITATGGGGAGHYDGSATNHLGQNGGSGGGGGTENPSGQYAGGTGISGQGFAGGSGRTDAVTYRNGGGGGGASQVGQNGSESNNGGNGGNGLANLLRTGSNETRAGGGGGARNSTGGTGGGGNWVNGNGANATVNTGSGGGAGAFQSNGGNGGSGIVVIRYEIAPSV